MWHPRMKNVETQQKNGATFHPSCWVPRKENWLEEETAEPEQQVCKMNDGARAKISFLSKGAPSVPYNADDIVVITHRLWKEEENRTGRVNPVCETKM